MELETQLLAHEISQQKINSLAASAVIRLISTLINLFFGLHLIRGKAANILHIIIGILLLMSNAMINTALNDSLTFSEFYSANFEIIFELFLETLRIGGH